MFLPTLRRYLFPFLALVVMGCTAQAPKSGPESSVERRIKYQVRTSLNLPPNIEVNLGARKKSDIAGFQVLPVTLSASGKKMEVDFLISDDQKTLARFEKFSVPSENFFKEVAAKINVTGRPIRGNKDAKVSIVNYDDFQCPFCSRMHTTLMTDVLKTYGEKVRIIYKDYPLSSIHPWAIHSAVNANCLNDQSNDAYWDYADYVHANQQQIMGSGDKKNTLLAQVTELDKSAMERAPKFGLNATKLASCVKAQDNKAVMASMQEAETLGVESTPTLFINGEKVSGALPFQTIAEFIDTALLEAGVTPPVRPKVNIVPTPEAMPKN
ncbi:MAG TPA: thioredoxin domain-containing protein [Terriglobales bacterium]|nr:thioredoxin domain-containing protein [Terriglobales bacterium]